MKLFFDKYLDCCRMCRFGYGALKCSFNKGGCSDSLPYDCPLKPLANFDYNSLVDKICRFKIGQHIWVIDEKLNIQERIIESIHVSFPICNVMDISYYVGDCVLYGNEIFESKELARSELYFALIHRCIKSKKIKKILYKGGKHEKIK